MEVPAIPQGGSTVSPYLVVDDPKAMLEFVKSAFGAQERELVTAPDGTIAHCEVKIGDSVIMIGSTPPGMNPTSSMLHIYTADCDAVFQQAIEAGATVVREVADQYYGDRTGGVADKFGNSWWIATHIEDVSSEEINNRLAAMKSTE